MWGYYLVNTKDNKIERVVGYDGRLSHTQGSIAGEFEVLYGNMRANYERILNVDGYRVSHIYSEIELIKFVFST